MDRFRRLLDRLARFEHKAHYFQVLLALIVASIILTWAFLSQRPPVVDPHMPRVAQEPLRTRADGGNRHA